MNTRLPEIADAARFSHQSLDARVKIGAGLPTSPGGRRRVEEGFDVLELNTMLGCKVFG